MSENQNNAAAALLNQYEKNNSPSKGSNSGFSLKNYFTTYLPDGVNSATKRVRILPNPKGGSFLAEVMGHGAEVDGGFRTFVCLKHENNEACPFCEAKDALFASGKDEDKKLAGKYSPRKMYVAKVIDRDKQDEGVKFWRFKHDFRKTGTFDKIHGVVSALGLEKGDISNPETGRDLIVSIARDSNRRPQIQSIVHTDQAPLNADSSLAQEWLDDPRTWEDVYSVKPYEYLAIIVKGQIPVWDKVNEVYTTQEELDAGNTAEEYGDGLESELTMGGTSTPVEETTQVKSVAETETVTATPADASTSSDDDDDLPF
jgi:hypothetical protein